MPNPKPLRKATSEKCSHTTHSASTIGCENVRRTPRCTTAVWNLSTRHKQQCNGCQRPNADNLSSTSQRLSKADGVDHQRTPVIESNESSPYGCQNFSIIAGVGCPHSRVTRLTQNNLQIEAATRHQAMGNGTSAARLEGCRETTTGTTQGKGADEDKALTAYPYPPKKQHHTHKVNATTNQAISLSLEYEENYGELCVAIVCVTNNATR